MSFKTMPPGTRFGKLIVIGDAPSYIKPDGRHEAMSRCLCDCGTIIPIRAWVLRNGHTKSCGCLKSEIRIRLNFKHGHAVKKSKTYFIWSQMKNRCRNPNQNSFPNYGGRGIKVCERWQVFENFLTDMGEKPQGKSIDRIDNGKDYSPENCKWSTRKEQNRNSRHNRIATVRGVTGCISELCEIFHLRYKTISNRLAKGWRVDRAFTEPVHNHKVNHSVS